MGQHYNVSVLRYRTPFEYAGQTPYMNDKWLKTAAVRQVAQKTMNWFNRYVISKFWSKVSKAIIFFRTNMNFLLIYIL
jgi:hypothetical protein